MGENWDQVCFLVSSFLHQSLLLWKYAGARGDMTQDTDAASPDDSCAGLSFVSSSESFAKPEIKGQVITCLGRGERVLCFHHIYTPPPLPTPPPPPTHAGMHTALFFLSLFSCAVMKKKNGQCLQVPNPIPQSPSDLVSCNLHPIKYWAKAFLNIRAKVPKWECVNTTSRNF